MTANQATTVQWHGCYDDSWKGYIVEEAFAHPAKFSRGLIEHIYKYMLAEGMIRRGETVVDPFGGIGTGGIIAASNGLRWVGCEIEDKFCRLATENFSMHLMTWGQFSDPIPRVIHGDSRKLQECLAVAFPAAAVVSSPPYNLPFSQDHNGSRGGKRSSGTAPSSVHGAFTVYGNTPGQIEGLPMGDVDAVVSSPPFLAARSDTTASTPSVHGGPCQERALTTGDATRYADVVVSSPPYHESLDRGTVNPAERVRLAREMGISNAEHISPIDMERIGKRGQGDYGATPGQLGAMPAGSVDSIVSSPPYAECPVPASVVQPGGRQGVRSSYRAAGVDAEDQYGETPGQLGAMKPGSIDGVISSPPWENQEPSHAQGSRFEEVHRQIHPTKLAKDRPGMFQHEYGDEAGNIGNKQGETFWSAARDIVLECHAILKPNGWSAWVVKDFVRNKARVPFCDHWCKLLEACGFTVRQRVHAMLVKEQRDADLFGGDDHIKTTERKSFFRRLAEKKGSPRIDWEEVIFAQSNPPTVETFDLDSI